MTTAMVQFLAAWFFGALVVERRNAFQDEAPRGLPRPLYLVGQRADAMLPLSELPPCLGLPQHPNQYSPERPVLLAVDQELGEGLRHRVPPELSDPVGAVEVGEHQEVERSLVPCTPPTPRSSPFPGPR